MGSRKKRDIDMSEFFDFLSTAQTEDNGEEEEDEDTPMPTGPPTDDGSDDMKYVYGDDYAAVEEDLANLDEADYAVMEGEEEEEEGGDEGEQEDDQSSYDENSDLPDFTAKGSYSMELAGQRKLTGRERRAVVNHLELPGATQGTLMAHVDHSESPLSPPTPTSLLPHTLLPPLSLPLHFLPLTYSHPHPLTLTPTLTSSLTHTSSH